MNLKGIFSSIIDAFCRCSFVKSNVYHKHFVGDCIDPNKGILFDSLALKFPSSCSKIDRENFHY